MTACEQKAWLAYFDLTYLREMWEGNMLWLKGFRWKIVNVFWLDRGPRVNRRRGSHTLTSRICEKCGTAMAAPVPIARTGKYYFLSVVSISLSLDHVEYLLYTRAGLPSTFRQVSVFPLTKWRAVCVLKHASGLMLSCLRVQEKSTE